ncbi:MAG: arginase family protein [Deltaproteobacteria bacterium]|nr:arginase family protein [Deltaproteobacteria bacterium]
MDPKLKEEWKQICMDPEYHSYEKCAPLVRPRIHDDVPSFMEVPIAWKAEHLEGADVVFLGFPWEGVVYETASSFVSCSPRQVNPDVDHEGRRGAYDAPNHIRKYSTEYSLGTSGGFYPEIAPDFRLADHLMLMDYRDVEVDYWDVEISTERAIEKVGDIVKAGAVPFVFGGDHSTPYPIVRGISDNSEGKIALILFDGHYDNAYGGEFPHPDKDMGRLNAGNAFYKILDTCQVEPEDWVTIGIKGGGYNTPLMAELAKKMGNTVFTIGDVEEMGMVEVMKRTLEIVSKRADKVYVSLDFDSIDPLTLPAQKYFEPFGLHARDVKKALSMISQNTNLAGFDSVCMGPAYDLKGLGGRVAARLYVELLKGIAVSKWKNS